MNTVIWIAQGLLAAMMLAAGLFKSVAPIATLRAKMPWANRYTPPQVRLIGLAEVAAGLGLILPAALGILPILTPIAASCLVVIMIGAVMSHLQNKESAVPALVPLALAVFVAIGRFVIVPIA